MNNISIYQIILGYLNILGISLFTAFLIKTGLKWMFPTTPLFKFRFMLGLWLVLIAILLLFRYMHQFAAGIIY